MKPKTSVFIATSLDRYIARTDGNLDWLDAAQATVPAGEDCGYQSLIQPVDVLIMGRRTYEKVLSFGTWPYGQPAVIILSSTAISFSDSIPDTVTQSSEARTHSAIGSGSGFHENTTQKKHPGSWSPSRKAKICLNEIDAINANQFFVIERDGLLGDEARFKTIMKSDLRGATEIQDENGLPAKGLPMHIQSVEKQAFVDSILAADFALSAVQIPEKLEGPTFGQPLMDCRDTLVASSDNEFNGDVPSLNYVFALPKSTSVGTAVSAT